MSIRAVSLSDLTQSFQRLECCHHHLRLGCLCFINVLLSRLFGLAFVGHSLLCSSVVALSMAPMSPEDLIDLILLVLSSGPFRTLS